MPKITTISGRSSAPIAPVSEPATAIAQLSALYIANTKKMDALDEKELEEKTSDPLRSNRWDAHYRQQDAFRDGILSAHAKTMGDVATQLLHVFHELDFLASFDMSKEELAKRLTYMQGAVASSLAAVIDHTGAKIGEPDSDYSDRRLRSFVPTAGGVQ